MMYEYKFTFKAVFPFNIEERDEIIGHALDVQNEIATVTIKDETMKCALNALMEAVGAENIIKFVEISKDGLII